MLRIKLIQGPNGQTPRNEATLKALGLRRNYQVVYHDDTPVIRGMIQHVRYALEVSTVTKEEATAEKETLIKKPASVTVISGPSAEKPAKKAKVASVAKVADADAKPKAAKKAPAEVAAKPKATKKKAEETSK